MREDCTDHPIGPFKHFSRILPPPGGGILSDFNGRVWLFFFFVSFFSFRFFYIPVLHPLDFRPYCVQPSSTQRTGYLVFFFCQLYRNPCFFDRRGEYANQPRMAPSIEKGSVFFFFFNNWGYVGG